MKTLFSAVAFAQGIKFPAPTPIVRPAPSPAAPLSTMMPRKPVAPVPTQEKRKPGRPRKEDKVEPKAKPGKALLPAPEPMKKLGRPTNAELAERARQANILIEQEKERLRAEQAKLGAKATIQWRIFSKGDRVRMKLAIEGEYIKGLVLYHKPDSEFVRVKWANGAQQFHAAGVLELHDGHVEFDRYDPVKEVSHED